MCELNDPAACMEIRSALQLLLFLAAGPNMRRIDPFPHLFSSARAACVQTQILWVVFLRFRTKNHDMVQGLFQQLDIMRVCSRQYHRQRQTVLIGQNTAFCPPFFPRSVGFFPTDSSARGAFTLQPSRLCHAQPIPPISSYFSKPLAQIFSKNPAASHF